MTTPRAKTQPLRMAICLGGTSTQIATLDQHNRVIHERTIATPSGGALMKASKAVDDRQAFTLKNWDAFLPYRERLIDVLANTIIETAEQAGQDRYDVIGVGLSAPGAIHPHSGEVLGRFGAMNLPAWGDFNLKEEIEKRITLPIRAINDAKAMALGALACMEKETVECRSEGEKLLGQAGRSIRNFVELDPGTGLGGAYIVDGDVWFGLLKDEPDPDVGEIWKLDITPHIPGSNLEEQASGRATLARVEKRLRADGGSEGIALLNAAKGRIQEMLSTASGLCLQCIETELIRTGQYLGMGIHLIMTEERTRLSAPEINHFVIGGGPVSGTTEQSLKVRGLIHAGIVEELEKYGSPPRILFTRLGGRAGLYGSAALI